VEKDTIAEQTEQTFIPTRVQKFRKKGYGFTSETVKGTIKASQFS